VDREKNRQASKGKFKEALGWVGKYGLFFYIYRAKWEQNANLFGYVRKK